MRPGESPTVTSPRPANGGGFAKLPNELNTHGIIAHLPGPALKVYLALVLACRRPSHSCFPSVATLARWSGVARNRVSAETEYLARHRLIVKEWFTIGGTPRRRYRVIQPSDPMFPDYRNSCTVCMNADDRNSCVLRDPVTGRLLGKRPRGQTAEDRDPQTSDHRDSSMTSDGRGPSQTEPDEKKRSRRGGGMGGDAEPSRAGSPPVATLFMGSSSESEPDQRSDGTSKGGRREEADNRPEFIRKFYLDVCNGDRELATRCLKKSRYTAAEIEEALSHVAVDTGECCAASRQDPTPHA